MSVNLRDHLYNVSCFPRACSIATVPVLSRAGGSNFVCPDCAKKHTRDSDMWRSLVSEHGDQIATDESADVDEVGAQHLTGLAVDDDKE